MDKTSAKLVALRDEVGFEQHDYKILPSPPARTLAFAERRAPDIASLDITPYVLSTLLE